LNAPAKDRIVRDPLYGFIDLDIPFLQDIINSVYFQRLRSIAQTGVTSFTYPSATHTRFAHSLGTMHVFRTIYWTILRQEDLKEDEKTHLLYLGCSSALMHDIGHGPLSHLTEEPLEFQHEKISADIVENTEIGDILESNSISKKKIREILSHAVTGNETAISQLVSSELDSDRLDYLARDAYFTGVKFAGVDVARISHLMRVYHGKPPVDGGVVIQKKGKYSIESYVLARHIMYQDVYYHKTTRGVEVLISNAIKRAKELTSETLKLSSELEFIREDRETNFQDILGLDDHKLFRAIYDWSKCSDETLANLANRIINRDLLKSIELSRDREHEYSGGLDEKIAELARSKGIKEPEYFCAQDFATETPYRPYRAETKKSEDVDKATVTTSIFLWDGTNYPEGFD
jgi:HD superfamily phosphohydrolase